MVKTVKQKLVICSMLAAILFSFTYREAEAAPQDSSVLKANALYGATVRGGSYADQSAATGSSTIPREILEAKTAGDESYSRRSHLEFEIPDNINWEDTAAVKLTLFLHEHTGSGKEDTVQVLLTDKSDLSEENWTWNNTNSLLDNAEVIGEQTFTESDASQWVEIDVTAIKEHLEEADDKDFGIAIRVEEEDDQGGIRFYSAYQDSGAYTPYLQFFQGEYQDTLPPTISVTGIEDGATVTNPELDIEIQAQDNHDEEPAVHLTVNGEAVEGAKNGTNTIHLEQGKNVIEISVEDAAGNQSEVQQYQVTLEAVTAFPVIADTYTDLRSPDENHNAKRLEVKKAASAPTNQRETYLSFDLSEYDAPYVKEAAIQFYIDELMGTDRTSEVVSIYQVDEFDEGTLTWNNAPERGQKVADAEYDRSKSDTYGELDITSFINEQLQNSEDMERIHFVLTIENGHDQKGVFMTSKEQDEDKAVQLQLVEGLPAPQLEVEGLEDGKVYTTGTIENVTIAAGSINESITVDTEVFVNGNEVTAKEDSLYDLPLQLGENVIEITATDQEGNQTTSTYKVTRLEQAASAVYYIDSQAGDDSSDGLTEETAWQSLEKLNTVQFQPGSTILLKRGSVWQGQLRPHGSGTEDEPITLDAYGDAAEKPKIEGEGISNLDTGSIFSEGAVHLYNLSHWRINNLEVTNEGEEIINASRAGIIVIAGGDGYVEDVHIDNVHVHDVNSGADAFKLSGGVIFLADTRDEKGNVTNIESGFKDISVENSHIHHVAIEGLRTKTYRNGSDTNAIRNYDVVFRKNLIEDTFGDGIVLAEVESGGLVEKNIARRHSSNNNNRNYAGVWLYEANNAVIQYNEVSDGVFGYNDGEAFDFDIGTKNSVFQYNYSRNNRGGFLLTMKSAGENNVFRHNVSYNDGQGTEIFYVMNNRTQIYNNTIYIGEEIDTQYLVKDNDISNMFFKNNLLYVEGNLQNYSQQGQSFDGTNMSHNLIYPAELLDLPGSPNPYPGLIQEDPMFANAEIEYTQMDEWDEEVWKQNMEAFQLHPDSPAVNSGTVIDGMGETDMVGNPIDPEHPTIGALQLAEMIAVTGVELEEDKVKLGNNSSYQLQATVLPENATNQKVTWSSDKEEVATVAADGTIQTHHPGAATITVTTEDGNKKATVKVLVNNGKNNQ